MTKTCNQFLSSGCSKLFIKNIEISSQNSWHSLETSSDSVIAKIAFISLTTSDTNFSIQLNVETKITQFDI